MSEDPVEEFEEGETYDSQEDYLEDQEELFRENPLKAIWTKLKEIEESLDMEVEEEDGE